MILKYAKKCQKIILSICIICFGKFFLNFLDPRTFLCISIGFLRFFEDFIEIFGFWKIFLGFFLSYRKFSE